MAKIIKKTVQELEDERKAIEEAPDPQQQKKEEAQQNRSILAALRKTVNIDTLSAEEVQEIKHIYKPYQVNTEYKTDDIFQKDDTLYKVVSDHTSQEDWKPEDLPALYTPITEPGKIGKWKRPLGAHDAYQKGEQVWWKTEDNIFKSTRNNNVWNPDELKSAWEPQP